MGTYVQNLFVACICTVSDFSHILFRTSSTASHSEILGAHASFPEPQTRVLGKHHWCAATFMPDTAALQAMNVLQAHLVIWAMNLHKSPEETWLDYRLGSFKSARYASCHHVKQRWRTMWLQRSWNNSGYRARGCRHDPVPGSTLLDGYRTWAWWERQRMMDHGVRHLGRFYPRLMNEERELHKAARLAAGYSTAIFPAKLGG